MQVSAELRWFWEGNCPEDVAAWFAGPEWLSPPIREERSDTYFVMSGNTDIGCKIRNADKPGQQPCEIKALITQFARNRIELWGKCEWLVPAEAHRLSVHKQRQMHRCSAFGPAPEHLGCDVAAAPDDTCRIELTQVHVEGFGGVWWTLGLEAWGDLASAPLTLARAIDRLTPPVDAMRSCNYPQFLDAFPLR